MRLIPILFLSRICRVFETSNGEGKQDVIEKAEDQKDRMKYAGLGLGRVGARGGGGNEVNLNDDDECETSGCSPKIEMGNGRLSPCLATVSNFCRPLESLGK